MDGQTIRLRLMDEASTRQSDENSEGCVYYNMGIFGYLMEDSQGSKVNKGYTKWR